MIVWLPKALKAMIMLTVLTTHLSTVIDLLFHSVAMPPDCPTVALNTPSSSDPPPIALIVLTVATAFGLLYASYVYFISCDEIR